MSLETLDAVAAPPEEKQAARTPPLYLLRRIGLVRRNIVAFHRELRERFGTVVEIRGVKIQHVFFVSEPDIARDILVTHASNFTKDRGLRLAKTVLGEGLLTSENPFHRRQRKLSAPAFHKQRIAAYADTMARFAARTADEWRDGARIDMDQEMMRLTLAIVAKTLFDAEVDEEADEIGEALSGVMDMFPRIMNPLAELLLALPIPSTRRFFAQRGRLDQTIYRIIAERRASAGDRGDLLSMLLAAQDEDDGSVMTDQQIRDEAITLFLAGHETTANLLTWTWYLLSEHPEVEARLHEEVDVILADALPGLDTVPRLPYTRRVLSESMRLFPPAHTLAREAVNDIRICGYRFPKGSTIVLSPYLIHRDARFWPEPERFNPDRWTPEAEAARPKFAYFPFGGGPRICIGEQFAWTEGILLLAILARRWRPRLVPGHPIDIRPLITLRPRHGMAMTVHRR